MSSKVMTQLEYMIALKGGEVEHPICSGYPIPNSHKPTKWVLVVGRHWFSHGCPVCGFGSGGSLMEGDYEKYYNLQPETKSKDKVYCHILEEYVGDTKLCPPKCPDRGNPKRCPLY